MKYSKKRDISRDFTSSKEFEEFKALLNMLIDKHDVSGFELVELAKREIGIPATVFSKNLSPLEGVTKYLHENLRLSFNEIGALLNRSPKTVWQAYKFGLKKLPASLLVKVSPYYIPYSVLSNRKFSILEGAVKHLHEHYKLRFSQIADLIYRDDRTIWTVYSRVKKKVKHES